MSLKEVRESLRGWTAGAAKAGVATLVAVRRSAPRPPGARFAANDKGDLAGSVSSGCVEGDLYEHIQRVIKEGEPRLLSYKITDEQALEVGLACGGEIDVLVARYDPQSEVWGALEPVTSEENATVLVTGVSDGVRARQLLLRSNGSRLGTLGGRELDENAAEATRSLFDTGGTQLLELEEPAATLFAEGFIPPPRLAIVGATPVAVALSHLASYVGIAVTLIDPRDTFAKKDRFPDADEVIHSWPEEGLDAIGLDRYWGVVVLAHDGKLDVPALKAALEAGCIYVGQIGGRRTQRLRREALKELGVPGDRIERIHGPIGLDIGAETPEEIALSIMAELLAVRRGARS